MATKKAVKKAVKKAAKKAAKKAPHHDLKHHEGKDLRRAYEHLGRLDALQPSLPATVVSQIDILSGMARVSLKSGDNHSAADLLRACEHLAFAGLASSAKDSRVGDGLLDAIEAEYNHLLNRAAEHWDEHDTEPTYELTAIYENSFDAAESAYLKGAYRRALEFVRAAEALSKVHGLDLAQDPALEAPEKPRQLKSK